MNRLKYIYAALLLCFGIGARAGNTVTIGTASGAPGTEVTVSVGLMNTDAVSALQFSIPLGEYLSYVNGSVTAGARLASHAASAVEKDGMLNVMVYSTSMAAISGQEGELFTFRLKLGNAPATVALAPTELVMTGTDGTQISGDTAEGSVSIRCAKAQYSTMTVDFGRVPIRSTYTETLTVSNIGNEPLTITSVAFLDATFSTTTALPLEIAAGSSQDIVVKYAPTVRGEVKTQMTVVCNSISKLNTIALKAQPFAVNELHVGDASGISDEEVTISLTMNNMDDICGMQANFQLPEQLEYVKGSFQLSNRKQDHIVSESLHDGLLRLMAFSTTSKAFTGNDGEIGHFKVKLVGRYSTTLKASEAVLTGIINGNTENVISADYGGQITISSPQLYADNTLQFGEVPVTEDVKKTFTIRNYGSAPLTVSRIVFDNESFSIEEALPLQVDASQSKTITVVNADKSEGDFATTMQIYSNDPDQRMFSVDVTGRVFAPNYLSFSVDEASANKVSLKVSMDNYDEIMGVQFDVIATNGYTADDANIQVGTRAQGIVVSTNKIDKNTLHVFAYMLSGGIARGDGELMTIGLVPGKALDNGMHGLTVSNIVMGVKDLVNKYAGQDPININFNVPTTIPDDNTQVVVTAGSYTRVYGDANPTFGFASAGATLTGTPEITCLATETSSVGTYPIVIKKGSITNNNVSYVNGTLTITKAPLTIKCGTYTKKQGEVNPDFTFSYEGFKNNETEANLEIKPSATTTATKESEPNEYVVTVSNAQAQNYEITYVNGKLIVLEADPVTVKAKSYTRYYGDDNPSFGFISDGAVIDGTPEIICEATATSPVGEYPIVISKGSVTNYNDTYVNGVLTITKAPLKISVGNYEKKQYDPMPEFSVQFEGFKNNETKDVLTKQPTLSCEANEDSAPGEYAITVSGAEAVNYQIQYVAGTLTVTEPDSYTLTYMVDGEVYQSFSIKYRDVITPLAVPTKEGYTFSGWSEIPETMPAKDVTVIGSFSTNSYTLTYMVDGEVYKTSSIPYGTTLTSESTPIKEGYTFSGWSEIPSTMPAKDVTVTGTFSINSYTLTYMVDGNEYKSTSVTYGTTITPEAEPTKEGYTFSGWSEIPSTMPAKDVTVTGSFSINSYTLTYMVDGEVYKTYSIPYGTTLTPEAEPTKEGYTFSGWSEIPATMPAKDVTVTGSFSINKYKLIYKVDGADYKTVEVEYGATITPEAEPTKKGYTFSGWSEIPSTMPAKDVTVTGTFSINKYKLIYKVDGADYKTIEVEYGATITAEAEPTKEGYTFSGWSVIPATMPAKDVTVTGTFTINSYTLTYMVDGEEYQSFSIKYREHITPLEEPSKEGYTFSGWSNIPESMPAKDVIVTGTFSINKYKLIYKVDGKDYKTIEVEYGATITAESEPTKEGYTFSGWSEIPATMPAKDVTVTGTFSINKYKLIYKVDGTDYKTIEVEYGATIIAESEPTKEGYTFSGWSEIPATMPAKDVVVTGTFTVNSYKLTYLVDGKEYKTSTVVYGTTITPESAPTKEGYTFSGWSEIPETMPAKDVTVTGTFSINKYKLIYKVDGTDYKTVEVEYGAKIIPEADPTKEGYTFSGWSEIPATMPAKDVTVTGTFSINSYTLTYMVDGNKHKSTSVTYGTAITPEAEPTKEGYTFSGWSEIPSTMPAKDVIVKGYFTINSYTITYVLDGEVYTTETLEYGAEIVPPVISGLEEYTIWEDVPATMPASDIAIYGKAKDIIDSLTSVFSKGEGEVYDSNGRKLPSLQKGLNIIRMKDGTVKKIIFK